MRCVDSVMYTKSKIIDFFGGLGTRKSFAIIKYLAGIYTVGGTEREASRGEERERSPRYGTDRSYCMCTDEEEEGKAGVEDRKATKEYRPSS